MTRSSVVLPQPDGPISEMNSPRPTASSMPASAWTGPSSVTKVSDRLRTSMTDEPGVATAAGCGGAAAAAPGATATAVAEAAPPVACSGGAIALDDRLQRSQPRLRHLPVPSSFAVTPRRHVRRRALTGCGVVSAFHDDSDCCTAW